MKEKGFTLVELLATIVVLAIIALIATPIVLGVIQEARSGAAKISAFNYIEAVEKYMVLTELDNTKVKLVKGQTYQVSNITYEEVTLLDYFIESVKAKENNIILNDIISIKGEKPTSGTITIGEKNTVESAKLVIKNYKIECLNKECKVKGKTEVDESLKEPEDEIIVVYPTILEKAKTLVYAEDGQTCKTDGKIYNYMGGCYVKGASSNNYVWYNGFMWRIMGINHDGTVRLIIDENVTGLAYGMTNTGLTYTANEGYIHDWLNEYFYNNLNSTKSIIQEGAYFCSQKTTSSTGRKECSEESKIKTTVGLMSLDEYLLAGSTSSYLNIDQISWLMTPYNTTNVWRISADGSVVNSDVTNMYGIRPVINVDSEASITAGDGTAKNFYVLGENKNENITGKISEIVTSGEYVNLEGHIYRVIKKEKNQNNEVTGIKLILDDFYEENEGTVYTIKYNSTTGNNTFVLNSGIGAKLNGIEGDNGINVITWLGLSDSNKIIETTYYQGDGFGVGTNYQNTLKKSNGVNAKVGLIQIGEILAGQSSTLLTKNYTLVSSNNNTKTYWTLNKYSTANSIWIVGDNGNSNNFEITNDRSIRPVITVRNDLQITSGTGTWKLPYEI